MQDTDIDWVLVRRAYADSKMTVNEICAHHKVGRSKLYRKIHRENWPKRTPDTKNSDQDIVERMMNVLERQLEQVDRRISLNRTVDVTALGNIARTYEKIKELGRGKRCGGSDAGLESEKLSHLRAEIVKKLSSINEPT